jgi:hypothetical protein
MSTRVRAFVFAVMLAACQGGGLAEVARATTPAEERAAFAALVRGGGVSFTAHDAGGAQLDMGAERWWERARTLRLGLRSGGETIEHRLIDPVNVLVLMQE